MQRADGTPGGVAAKNKILYNMTFSWAMEVMDIGSYCKRDHAIRDSQQETFLTAKKSTN